MSKLSFDEDGYAIVSFAENFPLVREIMGESWLDSGTIPLKLIPRSKNAFDIFWNLHPADRSEIIMYGEPVKIPRFQQAYLRDYKFSGTTSKIVELPSVFQPYLDYANTLGYGEFNSFLVNWYENGENYIGSHSDSAVGLVPGSPIITITLCLPGILRKFRIRDKTPAKTIVKDVSTFNGNILVMGEYFQSYFKHEIVKISGSGAKKAGARISITLRQHL